MVKPPRSTTQVSTFLQVILGPKDAAKLGSTDKKALAKAAKKHPLNNMLIDEILKYRAAAKLISQYLDPDLMGEDRVLYSLNPSGTDTGRLSSTKSSFDCGFQVQNVPEYAKQTIMADEGFYLGEADNEKSEAVCLGFISGDANLIESTTSTRDFHSINIERFFGRPYDEVWDSVKNKTKNKELRDLSKRVNHGTAYVMGPDVLLGNYGT
jgi:DNA polymerase I-like protein with 3'-5' exonuclease and polymerase domains